MDDYQVILYIIFGIIYFIFNLLKKKPQPVTREEAPIEGEEEEQAPGKPRREKVSDPYDERVGRPVSQNPWSFEELSEELEEVSGRAAKRANEKVKKVQEVDDEYQPLGPTEGTYSEQEAEKRIRETEARKALQEKASAAQRAATIGNEVDRKLAETNELIKSGQEAPQTRRGGKTANQRRQQVLHLLNNPENLKNVVVASEILKPKHF